MCCLITDYHNASYWVRHDAGTLTFDIGRPCLPLEGLLRRHEARSAAFITAHNPGSNIAPESINRTAQERLRQELEPLGPLFEGIGAGADWPDEPSFLVLGIGLEEAKSIGLRFDQNAIIWVEGNTPQIVRLTQTDAARLNRGVIRPRD